MGSGLSINDFFRKKQLEQSQEFSADEVQQVSETQRFETFEDNRKARKKKDLATPLGKL